MHIIGGATYRNYFIDIAFKRIPFERFMILVTTVTILINTFTCCTPLTGTELCNFYFYLRT